MTRTRHRIFVGKDVHKFSCAHMTVFPDGTKERLHGHNFQVSVAIDLYELRDEMFLDFGVIKKAVEAQCRAWAEQLLLPERSLHLRVDRRDEQAIEFTLCGKRYLIPADEVTLLPVTNVVVETLAEAFAHELALRLEGVITPRVVSGFDVTVSESTGQGGTYCWSWGTPE